MLAIVLLNSSLIDHIRTLSENYVNSVEFPYNHPEYEEEKNILDVFVPFLEKHSVLTPEEEKILSDFKEKYPIRTAADVEIIKMSLSDIVGRFFSDNDSVVVTPDGEWKIVNGGYDLVAEIYHNDIPVCGIISDGDGYEVNDYHNDDDIAQTVANALKNHGIKVTNEQDIFGEDVWKKVHQVITNAGYDGGIDDKPEYATIEEAIKEGKKYLDDDYLGFCVYNQETKLIEHIEGDFPLEEAFNPEILRLNGYPDLADEVQSRDFENSSIDKAKQLITYFVEEFDVGVDFDDLSHVNLAFRFDKETKLPIMVYADLENCSIIKEYNDEIVSVTNYENLEAMCVDLEKLNFKELVTLTDEEKARIKTSDTSEIQGISDNQPIDEDTPLFTDEEVIQTIQESEHADDFRFYPDADSEQLSLFGNSEPVEPEKTKAPEENPLKISIGDKFRRKFTDDIYEVVSLTGAMQWYTDQCTISRKSGAIDTIPLL